MCVYVHVCAYRMYVVCRVDMCVTFFFPLQSHEVQGRYAQVHRISYTILQNVATVHLTRSRGEKRGVKC